MFKHLFIIHLVFALLFSNWAQAAMVMITGDNMPNDFAETQLIETPSPVQNKTVADTAQLPPCHRPADAAATIQVGTETNSHNCCNTDMQCQCASMLQPTANHKNSAHAVLAIQHQHYVPMLAQAWTSLTPTSLFRPPIHIS